MVPGAPSYGMPQPPSAFAAPGPAVSTGIQSRPVASPSASEQSKIALPPPPGFPAVADAGKPKVRAVSEDPPPLRVAPPRVVLPTPESLGIRFASAGNSGPLPALDWNLVHARLEHLGVVGFQRNRLPQGGFRVVVLLPMNQATTHQIEGSGDTEAAAVLLALHLAEAWVASQR
jgi:hypothetical protein